MSQVYSKPQILRDEPLEIMGGGGGGGGGGWGVPISWKKKSCKQFTTTIKTFLQAKWRPGDQKATSGGIKCN